MTQEAVIGLLKDLISKETGISAVEIKNTDSFYSLGLDSVSCIFLMDKLEKQLNIELNPIYFWDYPQLNTYAEFLLTEYLTDHAN